MSEYVSLRVPEKVMNKLHRLKARMILEREEKVSDAEVVREALEIALNSESTNQKKKKNLRDFAGAIHGRPGNAAEDLHEVLYGIK